MGSCTSLQQDRPILEQKSSKRIKHTDSMVRMYETPAVSRENSLNGDIGIERWESILSNVEYRDFELEDDIANANVKVIYQNGLYNNC
eukprot:212584_1